MDFLNLIVKIPVLLFAITIHEYAHGRAAFHLGDPTAKLAGRLTWNPIKHLDPLGAICLYLFHFGWAKPVPINPRYFRSVERDMVLVSLAGPFANFAAAFLSGLLIRSGIVPYDFFGILVQMMVLNIGLGIFNLLPIPPLDGSHVLESMLPYSALQGYRRMERYAPLILTAVFLSDYFLRTGIVSTLLRYPVLYLIQLFSGLRVAW